MRLPKMLVVLVFICGGLKAGEKEPEGLLKIMSAVPDDALAVGYAAGYERLRREVLSCPVVRSLGLEPFGNVRDRYRRAWMSFAAEMETYTGLKAEEILKVHTGPVAMALLPVMDLNDVVRPVLVADVSASEKNHRDMVDRLLFRLDQMVPGIQQAIQRQFYNGVQVNVLPADNPDEQLCYTYHKGLFVVSLGETVMHRVVDALAGANNTRSITVVPRFRRALEAVEAEGASAAVYVDVEGFIRHGLDLDPDEEDIAAMKALGLDAVTGVMLAEKIGKEGVEDRLFVGVAQWRGIAGALAGLQRKTDEAGRDVPSEVFLYLHLCIDVRALLRAFAQALGNMNRPQQAVQVNAVLLTLNALQTGAGAFPRGDVLACLARGGGWYLTGALSADFSGNQKPLDALEGLKGMLAPLRMLGGGDVVELEGGRMSVGRPLGDVPIAPVLLEKETRLFLSHDPLFLRRLVSLKRRETLAETSFFRDFKKSVPGSMLAAGYMDVPFVLKGIPGLLGSLFAGAREKIRNKTGFDVLLVPDPGKMFDGWQPAAFLLTRVDDGLYLKVFSPSGLGVPFGGTAAAAMLERFRRRRPVAVGAPAGIVPDTGLAPVVDGVPEEALYAQAMECTTKGGRSAQIWLLTSGGRMYVAGKAFLPAGGAAVRLRLDLWTAHKAGDTFFSMLFEPGRDPRTSFEGAAGMPWQPPMEYKQTTGKDKAGADIYTFEASLPLAGFMVDTQVAASVWRLQVTREGDAEEKSKWATAGEPGYLILRALKGGMPGNLTEEMVIGRGGPRVPVPPVPEPPEEVVF